MLIFTIQICIETLYIQNVYFHTFNTYILKSKTALFVFILIIHAAAFIFSCKDGTVVTKDSYEYLQQSVNIPKYHSWYCGNFDELIQPELYSQRPPLYGFFLMMIRFFSERLFLISLLQTLISILNIYVAIKII